jgi:RNA polymerase sigma-70 factor (ECF subfamily)
MVLTASTGMSESELVGSLYVAHAERLLGFFMRRVFDPESARDLTAETFAQALLSQRKHRGSTEAEAEAWLYAIARHQLARYLRKGYAERRAIKRLGISLSPLSDSDIERIDELAGTERLRQSVAEALGELSAANRDAVELRVVAELPYPEVAQRLGISEATARARVSRSLRSLGSALELRHHEQEATT